MPYKNHKNIIEYQKTYRQKNETELIKKRKEYYILNRDKFRERRKIYWKKYYAKNKESALKKGREEYQRNRQKVLERNRRNALKLRLSVIEHYGRFCVCCREKEDRFLTIDHINNDGHLHRKQYQNRGGKNFYAWIVKNNYPNDLQILCWNCNMGKARFKEKICPHKLAPRL